MEKGKSIYTSFDRSGIRQKRDLTKYFK